MHLAEGVLSPVAIVATSVGAAAFVAYGLRALRPELMPLAALAGAAFFAASALRVPIGLGSAHLLLNGLAGLLLGWAVVPVVLVALLLQILLFGFGGFSVLGANLLVLGVPAVLAHYAARPLLGARPRLAGAIAAIVAVTGSALIAAAILALEGGDRYGTLIGALALAHVPIVIVEAFVTAFATDALARREVLGA